MMNKTIDVIIYSYKGKYTKDVVDNIEKNKSGNNNISIVFIDQHPLDRVEDFKKYPNLKYRHIFWDLQISPVALKSREIRQSRSDYVLVVADNVLLNKDWDEELISGLGDNQVISGNSWIEITKKNLFYIETKKTSIDSRSLTNFISREFFFGQTRLLKSIDYPNYLKYNGEEEVLSLDLFTRGIDVHSFPTSFYSTVGEPTVETLYTPFSINHNYNEALKLLKTGLNTFVDFSNRPRSVQDFYDAVRFDFNELHQLPFIDDDVLYNPHKLNFNKVDARKFIDRTRRID